MKLEKFDPEIIRKLARTDGEASKFEGGQVTIIGGSELFHGAPILALKAASRIVSMVFFASGEVNKEVAAELKAKLSSFIWIERKDLEKYIAKSDAVLIGPGLMRYGIEGDHEGVVCDDRGKESRDLTEKWISEFAEKKWVIDGGSLQVMGAEMIPNGALVTPNNKEFEMIFGQKIEGMGVEDKSILVAEMAAKYKCVVVSKGPVGIVSDGERVVLVEGGSDGLVKGGSGDVLAGVIVGLLAKNTAFEAATIGSYLSKKAAEELENERGLMFNADDVAERIPLVYGENV